MFFGDTDCCGIMELLWDHCFKTTGEKERTGKWVLSDIWLAAVNSMLAALNAIAKKLREVEIATQYLVNDLSKTTVHIYQVEAYTFHFHTYMCIFSCFPQKLLRGTIVNRTYGIHKHLYIRPFLLTIFGPINYGPP